MLKLINLDNGAMLANNLWVARSFLARLRGLMLTKPLLPGDGLHLVPCRSVHTFFMRYAIDVLHVDSEHRIVNMEHSLEPWKFGRIGRTTASVIELPSGRLKQCNTQIGQSVQII